MKTYAFFTYRSRVFVSTPLVGNYYPLGGQLVLPIVKGGWGITIGISRQKIGGLPIVFLIPPFTIGKNTFWSTMEFNQIELAYDDELIFRRRDLIDMYQNIINSCVYHETVTVMMQLARYTYYLPWDKEDKELVEVLGELQYHVNPFNYELLSLVRAEELSRLIQTWKGNIVVEPHVQIKVHNFGDGNKEQ